MGLFCFASSGVMEEAYTTLLANDTSNRRAIMQSSEGAKPDAMPGA